MKKTVLYDEHVKANGKMVEFAGYLLPIEYTTIATEHDAVRNNVGLFDVSHMGEIKVEGNDAAKFVNYLMTNDAINSIPGKMIYGLMLYETGGVVDDLMAYKYSEKEILLVVNASNTAKDFEYISKHKTGFDVTVTNESANYSQIALQGPNAINILRQLTKHDLDSMKLFDFAILQVNGEEYLVSRSGYTGSDGFEIYGSNNNILKLFKKFIKMDVPLCGLGCRDTLRFEAAMPLYGHEIDSNITPLEAGLNFAVKLNKDFIGKEVLKKQSEEGVKRKLVGLELLERGIARSEYEVLNESGDVIGYVTTGYMIPNTNNSYALALVDSRYSQIDSEVYIRIRKNLVKAKIRNKKFLDKKYIR